MVFNLSSLTLLCDQFQTVEKSFQCYHDLIVFLKGNNLVDQSLIYVINKEELSLLEVLVAPLEEVFVQILHCKGVADSINLRNVF